MPYSPMWSTHPDKTSWLRTPPVQTHINSETLLPSVPRQFQLSEITFVLHIKHLPSLQGPNPVGGGGESVHTFHKSDTSQTHRRFGKTAGTPGPLLTTILGQEGAFFHTSEHGSCAFNFFHNAGMEYITSDPNAPRARLRRNCVKF